MVSDGRKTAETFESVSQSESLFGELPNYAENQRVLAEMGMLDETAEAARFAEAQLNRKILILLWITWRRRQKKWQVTVCRD